MVAIAPPSRDAWPGDAERRDRFADLRALLDHDAVERRAHVGVLDRFLGDAHARARRRDRRLRRLHARRGHGGRGFGGGQRRGRW